MTWLDKSEQEVTESLDMAERIGSSLSEMHCCVDLSQTALARNDLTRAEKCAKRATDIAQRLGTERFRARALHFHAQALLAMNQREKAQTMLEEAIQLSRKTGPAYCGAGIIGAMVLAEQDPARRRRLIEEGESLLDQGAVAHNYLDFYQGVIEAGLERRDWKQAEHYAHLLEQFFSPEPLPLTDYVSARGRALSGFGRGQRDDGLKHQLERLRAQAREAGLMLGLPAIEDALQNWRKDATG
ncbi:MAG: tetratricopeptide repeat protein [Gammaproteobacteria bacterium]|nr:tetratricopeptide repeat protein [Gammaproteobacteria bacterium]